MPQQQKVQRAQYPILIAAIKYLKITNMVCYETVGSTIGLLIFIVYISVGCWLVYCLVVVVSILL